MSDINERLEKLEKRLGDLAAREEIRDVIFRYCRGADRCDIDLLRSCYHPDATDDHGFFGGNAWDLIDYAVPALLKIQSSQHSISNILITLDGDRAFVESLVFVYHTIVEDGVQWDHIHGCRYLDIFERRDTGWKILRRTGTNDGYRFIRTPLPTPEAFVEAAKSWDGGILPMGARGAADVSYLGFEFPKIMKENPGAKDLWSTYDVFKRAAGY